MRLEYAGLVSGFQHDLEFFFRHERNGESSSAGQLQNQGFQQIESRRKEFLYPIDGMRQQLHYGRCVFDAQGFGNDFSEQHDDNRQHSHGHRDSLRAETLKGNDRNQGRCRQIDDVVPD